MYGGSNKQRLFACFRLPPRCKSGRSSRTLRSVDWYLDADVSGQPIGPIFKGRTSWPLNPLTPNDLYISRTTPLTAKRCILYIYSTNVGTEYFKQPLYSPFFSLQNAVCFIMLTCLVSVLFTFYIQSVLKLKNNSGAKGLRMYGVLPNSPYRNYLQNNQDNAPILTETNIIKYKIRGEGVLKSPCRNFKWS